MKSWIIFMIQKREWVIGICILFTLALMSQIGHLEVVLSSDNMLPQSNHYVKTGREIEETFGNKYTVVVAVTATEGTVYQPSILEKIKRITGHIMNTPGVIKTTVTSLAARKIKSIQGNEEGMVVEPIMEAVPTTESGIEKLKKAVASNPVYEGILVSKDQRTALIAADFQENPGGTKVIDKSIRAVIDPERDSSVDISIGGLIIVLSQLEQFSQRMAFFLPLAILIVGLIHYEAFRTVQALILPLITAIIAVIWSISFLAISKLPLDIFNATTPILILAIAAGHSVQILKRYYEEFARLKEMMPDTGLKEISQAAIVNAMTKVGPVMIVAGMVAALGFFSLYIFEIKSIRTFGVLTGIGVLSALILELTFIPALRAVLRPPSENEYNREREKSLWDKMIEKIYYLVLERRKTVATITVAFLICVSLGGYMLKIENSQKRYFYGKHEVITDDQKINSRMAGSNPIYILVDTGEDDGIKNPETLRAIEKVQQFLAQDSLVGKTVSIVDFIKRMNQAMNTDSKDYYRIPSSADLVAQYLFLYSNSGEPGDFDSYVDYGYRKAVIQTFYKSDRSNDLATIAQHTQAFADSIFPSGVKIGVGGGVIPTLAVSEEMVSSKLLNILQILGCVFIISSLVFRSILAGALILTPLIATVFANFGFMGLFGIPLNVPNSLVAAMAVGVGADYAIYLSFRMREEMRSHLPEAEALRRAFLSAGKATIFVSTAVAGGFGVLIFSLGFNIHLWMGILIAFAMLVSSFSTLTLFASLILTLRPKFIFEKKEKEMYETQYA